MRSVPADPVASSGPVEPEPAAPEPHARTPHSNSTPHHRPHAPRRHDADVAHATHGRIRLKIPAGKDNPALLEQMRAAFLKHPGIETVSIKPATGSIVIEYDQDHHPDVASLFESLDHHETHADIPKVATSPHHRAPKTELDEKIDAFSEEAEYLAEHSHLARGIVDAVKSLDRRIKRLTKNTLDLKIVAPVGLAGFTFLEIGAAAATPMWVTLVIFSLNHFVELRAHTAEEDDAAETTDPAAKPVSATAPVPAPRG